MNIPKLAARLPRGWSGPPHKFEKVIYQQRERLNMCETQASHVMVVWSIIYDKTDGSESCRMSGLGLPDNLHFVMRLDLVSFSVTGKVKNGKKVRVP